MPITPSDITEPPAGYSFHTIPDAIPGGNRMWCVSTTPRGNEAISGSMPDLIYHHAFKRNDNGDIVVDQAGLDARVAELYADGSVTAMRIIPDAEFPEGGMTRHHTRFNSTARKWELPDIDTDIHHAHERSHDADVAAAVAAICHVDIDLMHRAATLANLNAAQTEKAAGKYADFDGCLDDIVDANAEPALEHAWIKSHGGIVHPGTDGDVAQPFVDGAHDFAAAYLAMINGKTPAQLGAPRYRYAMCLFAALRADAGKAGSARFLPRGVKLVERKSSPADAAEVTLDALFAKLKSAVSPAEGPAKGG